jgi:hypothetical protein
MYQNHILLVHVHDRCYESTKQNEIFHFPFFISDQIRTVIPHHSHRIPARHSLDQHVFLHMAHLEFVGKFPSRQ